jgi:hypothetical protein
MFAAVRIQTWCSSDGILCRMCLKRCHRLDDQKVTVTVERETPCGAAISGR